MEVHPPHQPLHTWKDFWIHLGTITIGLLLAIGLEQSVEALHHRHQRHQLQEDLRTEAEQNRQLILHDLRMTETEPWFEQALSAAAAAGKGAEVSFVLPPPPCLAGSVGTAEVRYFAPSQAVWTTARESGLVALLPVDEARLTARLQHNDELLESTRDKVADGCSDLTSMRRRFSHTTGAGDVWAMTAEQAGKFADTASSTLTAIQGLTFRLRWTELYEAAIVNGESQPDARMMSINQAEFEDRSSR